MATASYRLSPFARGSVTLHYPMSCQLEQRSAASILQCPPSASAKDTSSSATQIRHLTKTPNANENSCQFTEFGKPRSVEVTKLLPGDGKRHSDPEEEALSDEVALIIISPATYERLESTVSIISWSRLDPRRPC